MTTFSMLKNTNDGHNGYTDQQKHYNMMATTDIQTNKNTLQYDGHDRYTDQQKH